MRTLLTVTCRAALAAVFALVLASQNLASPAAATVTGAPTAARTTSGVEAYRLASNYDNAILYWTNRARHNHGKAPLRLMSCLDGFATTWSSRMAASDYMRHQSLDTVRRTCRRTSVAENIAWGGSSLTPGQVVRMWMRSAPHRRNILNGTYRFIGIGAYRSADTGRVYATQDFGR